MASFALRDPRLFSGLFDAVHTHTITHRNLLIGSKGPATYQQLRESRSGFEGLVPQLRWTPIAEIELYRGCTRRDFCSFCNEPGKSPLVAFREVGDILDEVRLLYSAGVRSFRLGQQTCFFSYQNRDEKAIEALLGEVRRRCPDLDVLHIDNADPLAVASPVGKRIARLVAEYCTDGNCAPMGMESFDLEVIKRNHLTCTPEILMRAIEHVNEAGASTGPHGLPKLLPGINLIYGLPGETRRTHLKNLNGLTGILDRGLQCHRTNVRPARVYPGTPLEAVPTAELPGSDLFESRMADITELYEIPMKRRVYPTGTHLRDLHTFFVTSRGTWHRRLGSYSIQVVEQGQHRPLYESVPELVVSGHEGRYIYGTRT